MSGQTNFTDLDFNRFSPFFSFVDKKAGIKASIGLAGKIPTKIEPLAEKYDALLIAVQDSGMGQDLLDRAFRDLEESRRKERIELLITRSMTPFDKQWYIMGDIAGLLEALEKERIHLPFSPSLYEEIQTAAERLKTK